MRSSRLAALAILTILSISSSRTASAEGAPKVKIGVLTDLSGSYSTFAGEGSVVATQMAVDDCLKAEMQGDDH